MKKWILAALALVIIGAIICLAAAASMGFDLKKLDNAKYETNTYEVNEGFRSIAVDAKTEKLYFKPSGDGACRVVCLERESIKHEVSVEEGTLTIKYADETKFTDHLGFNFQKTELTVYLPEKEYSALRVRTNTGDIDIPADFSFDSIEIKGDTSAVSCRASVKNGVEISLSTGDVTVASVTVGSLYVKTSTGGVSIASVNAGSLDINTTTGRIDAQSVKCEGDLHVGVSTGKTNLREVTCKNFNSEGSTGGITLESVIASGAFTIKRSTGDVKFAASDAASIFVETDTGDVTGSLLTDKVFIIETDTGKVEVPKSVTGGRCEISTDTGDIRISIG